MPCLATDLVRTLLVWGSLHIASGTDVESMIQHSSLSVMGSSSQVAFNAVVTPEMRERNVTAAAMRMALERGIGSKATAAAAVDGAMQAIQGQEESFMAGWKDFLRRVKASGNASPQALLHNAKAALEETGLLADMRHILNKTSRAMNETPWFDSYVVGVETELAPWHRAMREWGMHVVEGKGRLFANFEMPTNENPVPQMRMCVSSASSPSAVAKSRPERGVKEGASNVIVGLAKWDNLPGLSFGATSSERYQFLGLTDFGWRWTLQPIPENACFFYTLRVFDRDGLNSELAWVGASAAAAGPASAAISGILGKARAAATEALSPPFGRHSVAPVTDSQVEAVEDLLHVLSLRPPAPVEELPRVQGEGSAAGPAFAQEFTWCTPGWELLSGQGPKPLWTFVPEAPAPAAPAAL